MSDFFYIANRKVGKSEIPLIIAELGINHGGCLKTAFKMVDSAASAGVEIVKHQTHIVEDEMSSKAKKVIPGNADISIYEIMENCALSEDEEYKLKEYVESKGMIFISTPFSRAAADRLNKMDVPAYKIGSGECNNFPLLKHIAAFGKPIILSTGMNSIESITPAVKILREHQIPYALLHTTNIYPTPPELVRLGAMNILQEEFPDAVVGLSDHTTNNLACFGAVALGASILERHFTDSLERPGPDIVCSMDPTALSDLISGSQTLFKERGGNKNPVPEEQPTIAFAFASVVATKDIKLGEVLSEDNIWVRRPGEGDFSAADYDDLIGKTILCSIKEGEQLTRKHIES